MEKEKKKKKRSERQAAREGECTSAAREEVPTEAAQENELTLAAREEVPPVVSREEGAMSDLMLEIVATEGSNIECDIVDALKDSECITYDQGGNFEIVMAMNDLSVDRLENMPMLEVNGNRTNRNIQETALTEVVIAAPSAPAIEENCTFLEHTGTVQTFEEVSQVIPAISEENSGVYDDLHPLSEANLVALYENRELALWKEYSSVVADTRWVTSNNSLVNEKMGNLSRLRDLIEADCNTLEEHKKMASFQMDNVWSFEKRKIMETGECQDGNPVTAELDLIVSHFDAEAHAAVAKSMSSIKEICYEHMVLNLHMAELVKDFVESHIERICKRCLIIDSPAVLLEDFEQAKLHVDVIEMRTSIAMLMKFLWQRKQEDLFSRFVIDLLVLLVSIFLRAATWKDHMFMLHHVLGSPGRIPHWMISFVQVPLHIEYAPKSPFTSRSLHHLVCVLSVLMSPIEHRRSSYEFSLPDVPNASRPSTARAADERDRPIDESTWMIVDSDGEEDETVFSGQINSNDIIELFNQLPLQDMYTLILKLKKDDSGKYVMDIENYNDRYLLDLFAFCTVLIRLYEKGLHTYGRHTYQQFAKRLGQLINHTVQYVTAVFDSYRVTRNSKVELWLQCEYDMFVIRAVDAIYSSKDLGMWQFLATLPFHLISRSALWKIFYILHIEYDSNIEKKMPRNQSEWVELNQQAPLIEVLEDRLCALPESEAIYLLSALSSMALPIHENWQLYRQFFETLTTALFKIGFLSDVTQDKFSKHIRTLLASITTNNPWLISCILSNMRAYDFMKSKRMCMELFVNLPLKQWVPNADDLAIIRSWLCDVPLTSVEFSLARLILIGLNYNILESNTENDLVLGHNLHCTIALMVVEASSGFAEIPGQSPRTSTSTIKDMISVMCGSGGGFQVVQRWAWGLLLRLRIHSLDRGKMIPSQTISSPEIYLQTIPDLFGSSDLQVISNGVLARQPMACFVAILMTTWGHSVPLICTKGFPLILDVLIRHELYLETIACINLLVPMFIFCPESLIACDVFHSIVVALCSADRSTLRLMGTNLYTPDFPGPVLRHLGSMIESQLKHGTSLGQGYGNNTVEDLITLWLKCLAKVPDWINNQSVLYLMDIILRKAFNFWDYSILVNNVLNQELLPSSLALETKERLNTAAEPTGPEILKWLRDIGSTYRSLMSRTSLPSTPWFASFVLRVEKDWQEMQGLWFLVQNDLYKNQPGQVNVNNAIKTAISLLRIPTSIPASNLAIYRWGQQALDTPMDHPLLPYIWHVFFMLYLARLPSDTPSSVGGIGYKFYANAVGHQAIKKMKKQLLDTANFYGTRLGQLRCTAHQSDAEELFKVPGEIDRLSRLCRLFKTYHLWLEDARLMGNVIAADLSPMYDIPRLLAVFNNDDLPGRLMLSESVLEEIKDKHALEWVRALNRLETHTSKMCGSTSMNRADENMDKITKRLKSYDEPIELSMIPEFRLQSSVGPLGDLNQSMIPYVNELLQVLRQGAQEYSDSLAEHTAFVCTIQELLPLIYSNVQCEKVLTAMCHSSPPHRGTNYHSRESTCAGQAEMRVVVTESQANDLYQKGLDKCQKDWESSLISALGIPRLDTCKALVSLQGIVNSLVMDKKKDDNVHDSPCALSTNKAGVALLFHLISSYTEELAFFPPTREVIHQCMTLLAHDFLKNGHYAQQFLLALLEDMRLASVLSVNFHPVEASTAKFISMYGIMVNKAYVEQDYKSFFMILSQFDVPGWLESHRTTLADRSALIEEIAKAISAGGLQPDEKKEMLHTAFRKDLMSMLLYKFPENFGNILNHLLRASANQRVSLDVWYDVINSIMQNEKVCLGIEMPKLRDEIRKFANEQNSLPYHEILQTSELLANYFLAERKQFGLYGLYPKYRTYVEPLMAFQALIGHLLTVSRLAYEEGQLSTIICCNLWRSLESMYSPWITPLWTEQLDEPVAPWIEQLTEDRSVMLPWIPPDKQHASRAVMMFVEGVRFILDSVSVEVLSHLWEFYVTKFARTSVPEYVLSVIHNHLENLPWQQFRPNCLDIDLMYKVVTQSVPSEVHGFLGTIFVNVAWLPWLNYTMNLYKKNSDHQVKVHIYLLHLHVKMAREKEVRKKSKLTEMLSIAKKFEWHLVDATCYGQVVDWWVFRFDPRVAAGLSEPYINPVDKCVMNLLEAAAGFTTEAQPLHPTTLYKRVFYVRGVLKMLIKCTTEDRTIIEKNLNDVSGVVYSMLSSIENIIQRTVQDENRLAECTLLVKEVVVIFNQPESSELKKLTLKICTSWLQRENCKSYVVRGLLGVLGTDITNPAIMGQLLEMCFTTYFKTTVMQESTPSWSAAAQLLSPPMVPNIEDTLLSSGYFLTLHALLFKQIAATKSVREEVTLLTNLVDWICQVKPSELVESKLPLLWGVALLLVHRQCTFSESLVSLTRSVRRLISHFSDMSEEKGQFLSLLGTLGLRKNQVLSLKGRLLCRAMAAFLLAQLPEGSPDQMTLRTNANSPGAIAEYKSSGEIGPTLNATVDAVRALRDLEALVGMKSHVEMKDTVELAIKLIKDPNQTVNTAKEVLGALTAELYTEQYLHILTASN